MRKKIWILWLMLLFATNCSNKQPITVYTVGDSTMASYNPDRYPLTGWCQVLQQFFDGDHVIVKNHGSSGRSTKSFINEGRWKTVLDSLKAGDYVFIQFGHNDEKADRPDVYAPARGLYKENLEKMVNETKSKGAVPVLLTSIARRKFGDNGKLVDTHGEYLDVVEEVSKSMDVFFIDMHQMTTDFVNQLGDEPSKEIYLWTPPDDKFPEGRKDDTHLSEKGAKEYAGLAVQGLSQLDTPLKRHIKSTDRD